LDTLCEKFSFEETTTTKRRWDQIEKVGYILSVLEFFFTVTTTAAMIAQIIRRIRMMIQRMIIFFFVQNPVVDLVALLYFVCVCFTLLKFVSVFCDAGVEGGVINLLKAEVSLLAE
jgi:hypothetical protein